MHTLCVTAMLPTNMGGGGGKVAIIDTEGGFRPEKIGPIAERFGVKGEVCTFCCMRSSCTSASTLPRALTNHHFAAIRSACVLTFSLYTSRMC